MNNGLPKIKKSLTDKEFAQFNMHYANSERRVIAGEKKAATKAGAERSLQTTYATISRISQNENQLSKVTDLINRSVDGEDVTQELSKELRTLISTGNIQGQVLNIGGQIREIDVSKVTHAQINQLVEQYMRRINKAIYGEADFTTEAEAIQNEASKLKIRMSSLTQNNLPAYKSLYDLFKKDSSAILNHPTRGDEFKTRITEYETYLTQFNQAQKRAKNN